MALTMTKSNCPNHVVFVHRDQHQAARAWCQEHLGPRWDIIAGREGQWTYFWAGDADWDRYRFYFADAEDAVMFSLKWS
jgi:hypothetical protein